LHPSLLNFQQETRRKQKRDNLETLFGGYAPPCESKNSEKYQQIGSIKAVQSPNPGV
jgi:hypothetical protein